MSIRQDAGVAPIASSSELAEWLALGGKPRNQWKIGIEHEKFPYRLGSLEPVPYEGLDGIEALLTGLTRFGWREVREGGKVIGLGRNGANISLEPGGQFELSGAPMATLHEVADELALHAREANEVAGEHGIGFLAMGFHPAARREDVAWMPKGRYAIMRNYMPKVGTRGLDMMLRTCTAQGNFDFGDERDMVRKLRVTLKLQPIATALFASSPLYEGKRRGHQSERALVWLDVDAARTGSLPIAFEDGFGYERFVEYALDVPMYFIYRDGSYVDLAGRSFRDFMSGRLPELPGQRPNLTDWADHITTIFTETRLKQYLEMRGADVGTREAILALAALWTGVLYDDAAFAAAEALARVIEPLHLPAWRRAVATEGLSATVDGVRAVDLATDLVGIAADGLKGRDRRDKEGRDESIYLAWLQEITAHKASLAVHLASYAGNMAGLFESQRFL